MAKSADSGEETRDKVCPVEGGAANRPRSSLVAVTETSSQKIDLIILQTHDGHHMSHPRKTMEFLPHRVLSILV